MNENVAKKVLVLSALLLFSSLTQALSASAKPNETAAKLTVDREVKNLDNLAVSFFDRLPQTIRWAPRSYTWMQREKKEMQAAALHRQVPPSAPFAFALNASGAGFAVAIRRVKDGRVVFEKRYTDTDYERFSINADGTRLLEFKSVTCGDAERFSVSLIDLKTKSSRLLSDCTGRASLSPSKTLVLLEGELIHLPSGRSQTLEDEFPHLDVLAWSQDERTVALDGYDKIIVERLEK